MDALTKPRAAIMRCGDKHAFPLLFFVRDIRHHNFEPASRNLTHQLFLSAIKMKFIFADFFAGLRASKYSIILLGKCDRIFMGNSRNNEFL